LEIRSSELRKIPGKAFLQTPNLETLSIENGKYLLDPITSSDFIYLRKNLINLYLTGNGRILEFIKPNAFEGFKKLENLLIGDNSSYEVLKEVDCDLLKRERSYFDISDSVYFELSIMISPPNRVPEVPRKSFNK
jgi:hypothetical protein